ncbi:NAD(P)/FAD-dependent oxidoreductase (plasmid) [Halarchaeum sp. CBA1220]|uniref:FAD-dependent oxidoreductase n=1 Tax=Halarchaeum sp. CBA1220 TaxID=1853682 RepID=UPI000F3A874E|nr:FAD-dependent oxidoreductase [Halarchaeum sp. CBA1220]QLC35321.1 NAD(P)/FAD-dependent oxidoreductase [Halarchaeum sp. CBA1220]
MPTVDEADDGGGFDRDVVVVGGGPAGCSAAVFTARYGLDTVVFDRGNASLRRCAYLENYLGFPAGIDIETFYGLLHEHVAEAGADLVADLVETVTRDGDGFAVETQDGRALTARRVVAATRYDGDYLRALGDADAMFESHEHDGETHEHFDRDYPDADGRTPIDGVYVASPTSTADAQAIMAAGQGARTARTLLADVRRERGFPDAVADHYDWVRREADLSGEWTERDTWREWFAERTPDDVDVEEDGLVELREREIDRRLDAYRDDEALAAAAERGQRRLLAHVDDDAVLARAREIEAERDGGS